jgi:hypothetical protein
VIASTHCIGRGRRTVLVTQPPQTSEPAALRHAILAAVVYADLFDYPLSAAQIHHYLVGQRASIETVITALETDPWLRELVASAGDRYYLAPRPELVELQRARATHSHRLWPVARRYGAIIARLPFVRLVAVSGALAMDNAKPHDDIDYFLLVAPGRLWLCRLLVLAVVRFAALRGHELCPNYLLATDRLALEDRNVFTAHEVTQMVPLHGAPWYRAFLAANPWVNAILPNASDADARAPNVREPDKRRHGAGSRGLASWPTRLAAALLATPLFDPLERWERERKVRRLTRRAQQEGGNVVFSADECKGHFAAHDQRVLAAYEERIARYAEPSSNR